MKAKVLPPEKSRACCGHGFLLLLRNERRLNMFCPFCRRDDYAPITWGCIENYHEIIDTSNRHIDTCKGLE